MILAQAGGRRLACRTSSPWRVAHHRRDRRLGRGPGSLPEFPGCIAPADGLRLHPRAAPRPHARKPAGRTPGTPHRANRHPGHRWRDRHGGAPLCHSARHGPGSPGRPAGGVAADRTAWRTAALRCPPALVGRRRGSRGRDGRGAFGHRRRWHARRAGAARGRWLRHRAASCGGGLRRHAERRHRRRCRGPRAAHRRHAGGVAAPVAPASARSGGSPGGCGGAAAQAHRDRFQPLQARHAAPAHRAAHGHCRHTRVGRLPRPAGSQCRRGDAACQGPADPCDRLLPRPRGLRVAGRACDPDAARHPSRRSAPAHLGRRMQHGRGDLVARDAVPRGDQRRGQGHPPADLRLRQGCGCGDGGAPGALSGRHRSHSLARTAGAVLHA